jgi:putative effector of murein hydrolase
LSLAPKSATAGVAMGLSKSVHADPSLTAVAGVLVGIAMSLNALATLLLVPLAVTLLVRGSCLQYLCCRHRDLWQFLPASAVQARLPTL